MQYFSSLLKTKNENWVLNGGKILKQDRKHRYFFLCGDKIFKKQMLIVIQNHFNIQEYPKGDNKRYDTSYNPKIQTIFYKV